VWKGLHTYPAEYSTAQQFDKYIHTSRGRWLNLGAPHSRLAWAWMLPRWVYDVRYSKGAEAWLNT
jgi:hypothetical protein